ncbi:MAG: hypothetical protein OXI22_00735 [Defluviicoccus sp.]|nr:hypothetical protein [Defluviicoccus sp.]MDE0382383.1 hypothetical protein [Defluviicoccus sp.]
MPPAAKRPYARGFAVDAETERALRAGFPGREVKIQRGSLSSALRILATEPPSRLVFVDLDGVSDPHGAAVQLSEICAFQTALVAIGSTDTAEFSRALLRHGVSDYLVKPISPAAVREAGKAATEEPPEVDYAGRVVTFAGSAGSGTSTVVSAVAHGIAAGGRSASVVDLDPVSGKIPALLATEPKGSLSVLLDSLAPLSSDGADPPVDLEKLDAVTTPVAPGVSLIGYPLAGTLPRRPSLPALYALLKHLANRAHVVLVTGLTDPGIQLELMRWANARVLLYEPTLSSISAAVHRLAWLGKENPALLVQCSPRMRRYALSSAHIRYALAERSPDIVIPFDPALRNGTVSAALNDLGKACRESLDRVTDLVARGSGA